VPRITLELSDRALSALAVSRHDFQQHYHKPVPEHRDQIYTQVPTQVIALVDMGDGSYRLGGEFIGEYLDKQTGEHVVQRDTPPREPVKLTRQNFDAVARVDPWNGGENNIN
jgi:hypothetical protein